MFLFKKIGKHDIMNEKGGVYNMKCVLVTGSSSEIGREIVRKLASSYEVIIHYNKGYDKALKLKMELDNLYKRDFMMVKCDLRVEKEMDTMIQDIYDRYGKIDVLINNAAIAIDTLFEDKNKDNFMQILDVNLVAPFLLSKKIGLKMKEEKAGIIINVGSTNGIDTPYPESTDYDASKAGIISLTSNLANYLSPYVRVNVVCPGWINTPVNKNLDKEFAKREEDKILLQRFGEPEEVANVVKFLISDEASYINNSVIRIDGGKRC